MTFELRLAGAVLILDDEDLAQLAGQVAAELGANGHADPEPWIGVADAAEHIGATPSRIYALAGCKPPRIPFERDGSRLLFRRSSLTEWVENGGARRP